MLPFIAKRLAAAVGVILFLTAVVFTLQQVTPIDPVRAKLGANASAELVAAETARLGYDRPVVVQYVDYVGGLMTLDFSESLRTRNPVRTDLATFLPATLELIFFALLIALVLGLALGVAAAARWRGAGVLRVVMLSGASAPIFLLALLGILLFYRQLGWLPATGRTTWFGALDGPTGFLTVDALLARRTDIFVDAVRHLALPALALSLGPAVSIGRVLRSSLLNTMRTDYVRTARAKGLSEVRIVARHALRNSVGPALAMVGVQIGLMFAGVVVIESIFGWPGIGLYVVQSIPRADFPAIAAVTLVLGTIYVVVNAIVDVLQAWADPRITTT